MARAIWGPDVTGALRCRTPICPLGEEKILDLQGLRVQAGPFQPHGRAVCLKPRVGCATDAAFCAGGGCIAGLGVAGWNV